MGAYFVVDDAGNSYKLRIAGNAPTADEQKRADAFIAEKNAAIPKPAPVAQGGIAKSAMEFGKGALRGLGGIGSDVLRTAGGIGDYLAGYEEPGLVSRVGKGVEEGLGGLFGPSPGYEDALSTQAGNLTGILGGFLIPGTIAAKGLKAGATAEEIAAAAKAANTTRLAGEVGLGAGVGGGEAQRRMDAYEDQTQTKLDPDTRIVSTLLGGALGTTFAFPVERLAKPLAQLLRFVPKDAASTTAQTIAERLKDAAVTGGVTGAQNVIYGVGQDLVEKGLYNPNIDPSDSIMSDLTVGGGVGALMHFALGRAYNERLRPHKDLLKTIEEEDAQKAELKAKRAQEEKNFALGASEIFTPELGAAYEQASREYAAGLANAIPDLQRAQSLGKPGATEPRRPYIQPTEKGGFRAFTEGDRPLGQESSSIDGAVRQIDNYIEQLKKKAAAEAERNKPKYPSDPNEPRTHAERLAEIDDQIAAARQENKDIRKTIRDARGTTGKVDLGPQAQDRVDRLLESRKLIEQQRADRGLDQGEYLSLDRPESQDILGYIKRRRIYGGNKDVDGPLTQAELTEAYAAVNPKDKAPEAYTSKVLDDADMKRKQDYLREKAPATEGPEPTPPQDASAAPEAATSRSGGEPRAVAPGPVAAPESSVKPTYTQGEKVKLQSGNIAEVVAVRPNGDIRLKGAIVDITPERVQKIETPKTPKPAEPPKERKVFTQEEVGLKPLDVAVFDKLQQRLHGYGLKSVALKVRNWIETKKGGIAEGSLTDVDGVPKVIELATSIYRKGMSDEELLASLAKVMDHEVFHAVAGLLEPAEIKALQNFVLRQKMPGKTFTYVQYHQAKAPEGMSDAAIMEEAMSDAFRDWASGDLKIAGQPRSIMARIFGMFKRIGEWWSGAPEARDVFEKIKSGEIGKRLETKQPTPKGRISFADAAAYKGETVKYSRMGNEDDPLWMLKRYELMYRDAATTVGGKDVPEKAMLRQKILREAITHDTNLVRAQGEKFRIAHENMLALEEALMNEAYRSDNGSVPFDLFRAFIESYDEAVRTKDRVMYDPIDLKPDRRDQNDLINAMKSNFRKLQTEVISTARTPSDIFSSVRDTLDELSRAFQNKNRPQPPNKRPDRIFPADYSDIEKLIQRGDYDDSGPPQLKWPELHGPDSGFIDPMDPSNDGVAPSRGERAKQLRDMGRYEPKEISEILDEEYHGRKPFNPNVIPGDKKYSAIGVDGSYEKAPRTPSEYRRSLAMRVAKAVDPVYRIRNVEHAAVYNVAHDYLFKPGYHFVESLKSKLLGSTPDYALADAKAEHRATRFVSLFADRMITLAKMIDYVKSHGGTVNAAMDPYAINDLIHGKIANQLGVNERLLFDPMKQSMFKMGFTKADVGALMHRLSPDARHYLEHTTDPNNAMLGMYLYAKHAPERNAVMRVMNPNGKQAVDANGRPIEGKWWGADRLSGLSNDDAAVVMDYMKNHKSFDRLIDAAQKARAVIDDLNRRRVEAGMIPEKFEYDPEEGFGKVFTEANVRNGDELGYADWVPLRGFAEDMDWNDTAPAHGRGFSALKREDPRAAGRGSMASKIVENIIAMNEKAITRAERMKVGQAFLKVVEDNPEILKDMATVQEHAPVKWTLVDGAYRIKGQGPNGEITLGKGDGLHGRFIVDPLFMSKEGNPYFLVKRKKGDKIEHVIVDIKVPELAKAMKGEIGIKSETAFSIINHIGKFTRLLANLATSWNPEFLFMNMQRDIAGAGINLQQFELDGVSKDMVKNIMPSMRALYQMTPKARTSYVATGKADHFIRSDIAKLPPEYQAMATRAMDFIEDGGSVEFQGIKDLADITSEINDGLRDPASFTSLEKGKKAIGRVGDFIESYNKIVENSTRLAVYSSLRDALVKKGMGEAEARAHAARAAKNMTANFNRGGELKPLVNALYMFYNASVQGSMALAHGLVTSKRVQAIAGSIFLAGAAQDAMMGMISPEDENGKKVYDNIPEWALQTRMIFIDPFGVIPKGYLAIPMPHGFSAIFNAGRATMRGARGTYTPGEAVNSLYGSVLNQFDPVGGTNSWLNFVAPTVLDPIVDLSLNTDYKGDPIAKTPSAYGVQAPQSQLHWNNTSPPAQSIAEWLNYLTGGDSGISGAVDISPDQIDYVAGYLTGGAGRFIGRLQTGAEKALSGDLEDLTVSDVPVVRALVGGVSERSATEQYIQARQEVLQPAKAIKDAAAAGDAKTASRLRQAYGDKLRLMGVFQAVDSARNKLSNRLRQIQANVNIPDDRKEALSRQIKQLMLDQENRALRAYNGESS